jgi:hypothetical protein
VADEIQTQFTLPDPPNAVMDQWRDAPPAFLTAGKYELVDEAYDGLVFEADVTSFGTRLLMFGSARTLYRLSVNFESDGGTGTRVTIIGQAPESVRERIEQAAAEHGGPRGPID